MIHLFDSFNNVKISSHRTLMGAVKSQYNHALKVKRANGINSYITYSYKNDDNKPIDWNELLEAKLKFFGV